MTCPKCGGRLNVLDVVNTTRNQTYRKRRCPKCNLIFFTSEEIVNPDKEFKEDWCANYRKEKHNAEN